MNPTVSAESYLTGWDYWNRPWETRPPRADSQGATDTLDLNGALSGPPVSRGPDPEFFEKQAERFRKLVEFLEWRKEEHVKERLGSDQEYLDLLDQETPSSFDMPTIPEDTNDENEGIMSATKALMKTALFNHQIILDEENHESGHERSSIRKNFCKMAGYYQDSLCHLRCEMAAREIEAPDDMCLEDVIPRELRCLGSDDRSRRYDRDYCIIKNSQDVLRAFAKLFKRLRDAQSKRATMD